MKSLKFCVRFSHPVRPMHVAIGDSKKGNDHDVQIKRSMLSQIRNVHAREDDARDGFDIRGGHCRLRVHLIKHEILPSRASATIDRARQQSMENIQMSIDPESLHEHHDYLVRYAILQLRDPHLAEDAVQETLIAAIESGGQFAAQSSVRTWLVGILKHKILDMLRRRAREPELNIPDGEDENDLLDALFKENGHWSDPPKTWADPEKSLESAHFWEVFEQCCQRMPLNTARAFMMREFMEMSTEEICQELSISTTNCWVLLHRARLALRECLNMKWFENLR